MQTDRYSVQLTTLYDSNQRQSYIVNEVALAQALRYVQVPERTVDTSSATLAKTTKLFILDVRPRSTAAEAGAQLLTAYGVSEVELTLPEEPRLDMLRFKFGTRPGHLSNAGVAQPEAMAHLVIGRDNPAHMPGAAIRSEKDGTDLYVMRNDLFVGEMLYGEKDKIGQKKKGAAGGPKTTSTPKPKQLKARDPQAAREGGASPESANCQQAAGGGGGAARGRTIRHQEPPPAGQLARPVRGGLRLNAVLGERGCERHAGERRQPEEEQFERAAPDLRQEEQSWRGKPGQRDPRGQPKRSGAEQQRQRDPRGQLRKSGAGQQRQRDPRGHPGNSGARQQRQHL